MSDAPSAMTGTASQAALARLSSALDQMEAAIARHGLKAEALADMRHELDLMRSDRHRLAELLDVSVARGRALENAHNEVDQRIERAITTVRMIIDAGVEA
jgi:multidrug resistance efflux pump